jgi:hypothetical protein
MTTLRAILASALLVVTFEAALAKLPPPPPMTDEQKAAAEEKKAKAAAAAEVAKAQLAKAQDRVAARYMAEHKGMAKTAAPPMAPAPANQ